jgi:hypothetical protein
MRARATAVAALALLCAGAAAAAHPIVIHAGLVEWTGEVFRVTVELDPHSYEHEAMAAGGAITRRQAVEALVRGIEVVPESGNPVSPVSFAGDEDGSQATCEYSIPAGTGAVALLHRSGSELGVMMRQFQLAWRPAGAPYQTVLRLTSGGNYAVVRADCPDGPATAIEEPFVSPALRVILDKGEQEARLEIDYPCALLATWRALIHIRDGCVSGESFEVDRAGLVDWAQRHLVAQGGQLANRTPARRPVVTDADLIGPCGEVLSSQDGRWSVFTTRVRFRVSLRDYDPKTTASIEWTGFNAAILSVPVESCADGQFALLGVLTSEQPVIRIAPGETPAIATRASETANP